MDHTGTAERTSRRRRILLSGAALTGTFTLTVVIGALRWDELASPGQFLTGWLLTVLLFGLCWVLPWDRVPYRWVLAVPLVDLVGVGLARYGAGEGLVGVGLLAAFPVVWIAASRVRTRTAAGITLVASVLIVWLPLVLDGARLTFHSLTNPIMLPMMLTGLALFVSVLIKDNRARQLALVESQAALQRSIDAGRERERLLGTVFDTVGVGLLAVDADGHDILMNARLRAAHLAAAPEGNDDPAEAELLLFGADRVTPLPVEDRPVFRAIRGEDLDAVQMWSGSGRSQRALTVNSSAMRDDDGAIAGTVVSFHDSTDLVLALQAKDDFLSNVSHEFRTPLTSMLGYLDVALEYGDELPGDTGRFLEVARRNALRLERLVEDLLAIHAGTFEVSPVPSDVGPLLAQAAASAEVRAGRAGLTLRNSAPSSLPAVVDPVRLGQAVDNLLVNAVKYNTPGGSVQLDAFLDDDDGALVVVVSDTGIGIGDEDLHHLFERFFRSPSVRTSTVPGVGLGLLITRSIVSEHGGSVSVDSTLGEGTCFRLSIPQPEHRSAGNS